MNLHVDLNADLGEDAGHDAELLTLVSTASIATGFHAGNPATIAASIASARDAGVTVGAHPGFADRENFGRREIRIAPAEVFALVAYQVGAFHALANAAGVRANHVKPHGALYNMAVRDPSLAEAVARAVAGADSSLILFAPDQSELARAGKIHGLQIAREVFADRNYLADGSLVPRSRPDALLHEPTVAAERVIRMLRDGFVSSVDGAEVQVSADTICLHGDTLEAVEFARALRSKLSKAGIEIASVGRDSVEPPMSHGSTESRPTTRP